MPARLQGPIVSKIVTLPASGRSIVEFESPRRTNHLVNGAALTPIRSVANKVILKTTAAGVTVSTDGGTNTYPIPASPASGEEPVILEGFIHTLLIQGAVGNVINVVATLAS